MDAFEKQVENVEVVTDVMDSAMNSVRFYSLFKRNLPVLILFVWLE